MPVHRIYNFSAGPAVLPLPVLEEAQRDLVALPGVGMSVLEISHRSKPFDEIIQGAEADMRALAGIPDNYKVLFVQGGASLQFSRGCPFRCEFCDIIVMFGRRPRVKCHEQVGRELDALRAQGVRRVFFVDDNLIGNKPQAKELMRYLRRYQEEHDYTFSFGTEASLNLAHDEELLRLFREANFSWVFIGIESPDVANLKDIGKTQNLRQDMLGSVRTIYAQGIDVLAGFIVGFDNDTLDSFERQYRFITASGIQVAMVGLLTALPRTPLYERLEREGRLLPEAGFAREAAYRRQRSAAGPDRGLWLGEGHFERLSSRWPTSGYHEAICTASRHANRATHRDAAIAGVRPLAELRPSSPRANGAARLIREA